MADVEHECPICGETYPNSARCYGWVTAHTPVDMVPREPDDCA